MGNNKTTKRGAWGKMLYTLVTTGNDISGGQEPSVFLRLCVPVIDGLDTPFIDDKCPMDSCGPRADDTIRGVGCGVQLKGEQQDMIQNDIGDNISMRPSPEGSEAPS